MSPHVLSLAAHGIRAVVLDIEGTTTPIAFVHEVLFPYARARLRPFIIEDEMSPVGRAWIDQLHAEWRAEQVGGDAPPAWTGATVEEIAVSAVAYCEWLMDRDRKSPALKELQGLIWKAGYEVGELRSNVFADVPAALGRWREAGIAIAIYSSGSVLAQKLLFGSSDSGDLTPLIDHFFDTGVGPKTSPDSYARIAASLGLEPRQVLFVSDVTAETGAAGAAGMQVALCVRPGNPRQPAIELLVVRSFDEVTL
jgi:enolase-phosphatase E1